MEIKVKPPMIGIRGYMGAGKDTLAALIKKQHPEYSTAWKFAGPLRRAAEFITGIPAEQTVTDDQKKHDLSTLEFEPADLRDRIDKAIEYVTGKEMANHIPAEIMFEILTRRKYDGSSVTLATIPMTVGRLLQVLGTDCFREVIGTSVWTNALVHRWQEKGCPSIVLADARFKNETHVVREHGGVVILIVRGGPDALNRTDGREVRHVSETALDDEPPDITIRNDGTIEDLERALEKAWPDIVEVATIRAKQETN